MLLQKLNDKQFLVLEEKELSPRNLSASAAVPGLRRIEDLFAERIGRMIQRALGPVMDAHIPMGERELRVQQGLALLMPDIEEAAIELITQAYKLTMDDEGISAFNMPDEAAIQHIISMPDGLVPALSGLSEDIRRQMEQVIKTAQATPGFTLPKLIEQLQDVANLTYVRVDRIARTESTRVANVARETQWAKIGMDPNAREYHWIRAQDARVCQICKAIADGNPWTLPDLKRVTSGWVVHPGCRCTLVRRPLDKT